MTPSLFELFQKGGLLMWPILLCSVVALGIVVERLWWLGQTEADSSQFFNRVLELLREHRWVQARQLCEQTKLPLSRVVQSILSQHPGTARTEIRQTVESVLAQDLSLFERHIPILGTIAHIAPLLGLLGTVTGLVRCFQVIQEKASSIQPVNPGDLAGGIWEALLTTVFGLLVAIPAYAAYNYLVYRVNQQMTRMESMAEKLLDLLPPSPSTDMPPAAALTQGTTRAV